jgi:Tubulin binding cofactor C
VQSRSCSNFVSRCSLGRYKSLHLVNVRGSSIVVPNVIQGAVHVTNCHSSQLTASAQQLRLHDCRDLTCIVSVSAGAIMEGCQRMAFVNSASDQTLDVKDFDWLRHGIQSPNFTIQNASAVPTTSAPMTVLDPLETRTEEKGGTSIHQPTKPNDPTDDDSDSDEL